MIRRVVELSRPPALLSVAALLASFAACGSNGGSGRAAGDASGGAVRSDGAAAHDLSDAAGSGEPDTGSVHDAGAAAPDALAASDTPIAVVPEAGASVDAGPVLPPYTGPAMRIRHNVKPKDTDPVIDKWLDDHVAVVDTRVKAVGKLYVFLAGGNGVPSGEVDMLDEAAKLGLHAIGPRFTTDVLVADVCPGDPDPNCSGNVRKEVLEGMDLSPHLVVTPANSLANRVAKLLVYLGQHFPGEGWGYYLDGAAVRWSEVIIAGRSLGSSEAACVGMRRAVYRVEMHSGPGDSRLEMHAESAPWLKEPSLTPPDRMWGFSHTLDPGHVDQKRAWAALGLTGAPTSVDGAQPPYGGSHQLITSFAPPGGASGAHGSTTAGGGSPKLPDGSYRFAPVWRLMMGL